MLRVGETKMAPFCSTGKYCKMVPVDRFDMTVADVEKTNVNEGVQKIKYKYSLHVYKVETIIIMT